jgi:glycosyltransferase involved in cell wall biosynthesis
MTQPVETLLSIIIPAYNEEGAIGETVVAIQELNLEAAEILVVDDGSSDATGRVAEAAGARVISHPYNIGNGAAVKSGIRASRGKVLVFLDGDGQHDPKDIPRLLAHIPRYHMVVGARQRGSQTHAHRSFANMVYNKFASFVAKFKIEDLTSGFRAMRRKDAVRFCDMFPNTFSYPTTSTLAFIRSGRSVKYIPIKTKYRVGKSKIKLVNDGFEFLIIIMKIALTFSPLRVFMPVSSFLFFLGVGRYIQTYILYGRFTNFAGLAMNSAFIVFMLGLVAEQIASLRMEKGDDLFEIENADEYATFASYARTPNTSPDSQIN